MSKHIAIAGSLAQKPRQGGHTWQFLNYLLGFRRLGWKVLFVDRLEPEMCFDEAGRPCAVEDSVNLRYFLMVMERFGLGAAFSLDYNRGEKCWGVPRQEVRERLQGSAFLLNVMGFLTDEELLASARRRVFLDTDPGFGQMWQDLGQANLFRGHDDYVTIAENIGQAGCTIPTCGLEWITWRQPIVLGEWPCQEGPQGGLFTSIGSWRGPYAPIEYHGKTYGLRAHEFRKFVTLPRISNGRFQVALDIHSADARDLALLAENGWSLADPTAVACDPWVYRQYIQQSRAEFMATKGIYVDTHSGWFSERSICYLASGRPVLAQDTRIPDIYPVGEGLLTFTTLDEAAACVEKVLADYPRHCRAARRLAEEFFDSDRVLPRLLKKLDIDP
jgi:hypothetical protein